MTVARSHCFVIRICGSGKVCADSKFSELSVFLPPMNSSWTKVFAHFEGLTAPFFGASPDWFTTRDLSALD